MKINIHGRKLEVTEAIKNYVSEKLKKLDKYFENPDEMTATVVVKVRGNDQIIEVTVPSSKFTLRGEESHKDLYAAIDLVTDKIERQIRKNKTKIKKNFKEVLVFNNDIEEAEEDNSSIVHDFFVFNNTDTGNVSVIYKRKEGNYGIIDTK